MNRNHKTFLKNVACFPQKINKLDMAVMTETFSAKEIFHIILLVSTVKMRLQMTYYAQKLYEIIKSIE